MKKLSIMFGMALILALTSVHAFALSFGLDVNGDGVVDDPAEVTIMVSDTIDVDIYLLDWEGQVNLGAIDYTFTWDSTSLEVTGTSVPDLIPNGAALWDASGEYPGVGFIDLSLINFGAGVSGSSLRLHRISLHCTAIGDAAIEVVYSYLSDTQGNDTYYPTDANGVIHQTGLDCGCEISPDSVTLGDNGTQQFNATQVNPDACNPSDYAWSDDCAGGDVDASGFFTANATVANETCTVTVIDNGNPGVECAAEVTLEETPDCRVTLNVEGDIVAQPGDPIVQVPVSMDNSDDLVLGIETLIMDENDSLTCIGCTPNPVRVPSDFMCLAYEQDFGECKILLFNPTGNSVIEKGSGTVFTVDYDSSCVTDDCIDLELLDEQSYVSDDQENEVDLCDVGITEDAICFNTCGDVFPAEGCGDGVVNIFDILEEIDFVLGITEPSVCQADQGDVPTSLPPVCNAPDDEINIFDVLVIIDKALEKPNCCDY